MMYRKHVMGLLQQAPNFLGLVRRWHKCIEQHVQEEAEKSHRQSSHVALQDMQHPSKANPLIPVPWLIFETWFFINNRVFRGYLLYYR